MNFKFLSKLFSRLIIIALIFHLTFLSNNIVMKIIFILIATLSINFSILDVIVEKSWFENSSFLARFGFIILSFLLSGIIINTIYWIAYWIGF